MGIFLRKGTTDEILVSINHDSVKDERFARLPGGSIEFGELSINAFRREMREELETEVEDPTYIGFIENVFIYEGEKGHTIDFLYTGKLARKEIYRMEKVPAQEPDHRFVMEWVPMQKFLDGELPLYPAYDYLSILGQIPYEVLK